MKSIADEYHELPLALASGTESLNTQASAKIEKEFFSKEL
jgi:hypothetical protein